MPTEVKLSHLYDVLEEYSYPLSKQDAVTEGEGTVLLLADGTIELSSVIADIGVEEFVDRDELVLEVMSHLPQRAVGEPYQSEGDA